MKTKARSHFEKRIFYATSWRDDHSFLNSLTQIDIWKEYDLCYEEGGQSNDIFALHYNGDIYLYEIETGRWQSVSQKDRSIWYHSRSPGQFVKKYILKID